MQTTAPGRVGAGVVTPFNPEGTWGVGFSNLPPVEAGHMGLVACTWAPGPWGTMFREAVWYPQSTGSFQQERQASLPPGLLDQAASASTLEVYFLPSAFHLMIDFVALSLE